MNDILRTLTQVLEQRKNADPETSYVARLFAKGDDAILKKVGEEATEVVLAAKGGAEAELVHEVADLWFHTLVLLSAHNVDASAVLDELQRRLGTSGLEEKRSRGA